MLSMGIVHCSFTVDDFVDGRPLPPVEQLRPVSCPSCGQVGHALGQSPNLIGHGSYARHVRGATDKRDVVKIRVRRFLCLHCRATTTVLPSEVYPRRHYTAPAILASLVRVLLKGQSTNSARQQLVDTEAEGPWRSPLRWKRELFAPLWSWEALQLGFKVGSTNDTEQQKVRLFRLLALHGVGPSPTELDLSEANAAMFRGLSRRRVGPGTARRRSPLGPRLAHPHSLSRRGTWHAENTRDQDLPGLHESFAPGDSTHSENGAHGPLRAISESGRAVGGSGPQQPGSLARRDRSLRTDARSARRGVPSTGQQGTVSTIGNGHAHGHFPSGP